MIGYDMGPIYQAIGFAVFWWFLIDLMII